MMQSEEGFFLMEKGMLKEAKNWPRFRMPGVIVLPRPTEDGAEIEHLFRCSWFTENGKMKYLACVVAPHVDWNALFVGANEQMDVVEKHKLGGCGDE